jgi:hypothetical protein
MWNKKSFHSKRKPRVRREKTFEEMLKEPSSILDVLDVSENSPAAKLLKAMYADALAKTKQFFLNPELDNQIKAIPVEIFWHILIYTSYKDWYNACLVSKSWHEKLSERFAELKDLYQIYNETSKASLVQDAENSEQIATVLFMSDLVDKISYDELIAVASHTSNHLDTLFRRGQFFSHYYIPDKTESRLQSGNGYNLLFNKPGEFGNKTLVTLAQSSPQHAEQVIRKMVCHLNGYTLMNIAKISVDHAKIILSDKHAKARLKQGHLIGIAKRSLAHTKFCMDSPQIVLELGSYGLGQIIGDSFESAVYSQTVYSRLLNYASHLPLIMARASKSNINPLISILLKQQFELFFSDKNPVWLAFKQQNNALVNALPDIVSITQELLSAETIVRYSLLRIALLSPDYLNTILLNSKTHNFFDEKAVATLIKAGDAYQDVLAKLSPKLLEKDSKQYMPRTLSFRNM